MGVIALAIGLLAKRHIKLEEKSLEAKQKERMNELRTQVKDEIIKQFDEKIDQLEQEDNVIREEIKGIKKDTQDLVQGVLAIHGRDFRGTCRYLLRPEHVITLDEFEQLDQDHEIYKSLGGNHRGDDLYQAVITKWHGQLKT